jgi:hypothetical protein
MRRTRPVTARPSGSASRSMAAPHAPATASWSASMPTPKNSACVPRRRDQGRRQRRRPARTAAGLRPEPVCRRFARSHRQQARGEARIMRSLARLTGSTASRFRMSSRRTPNPYDSSFWHAGRNREVLRHDRRQIWFNREHRGVLTDLCFAIVRNLRCSFTCSVRKRGLSSLKAEKEAQKKWEEQI